MLRSTDVFRDRAEAGRVLAERLEHLRNENPVVLGLARGGVIVAAEVAKALGAPLEVMVARKIGAPNQPELGIGAVAPGGVKVVDELLVRELGIPNRDVDRIAQREQEEVERRVAAYRDGPPIPLEGRTVILVDDGLATGVTALAAARSIKKQNPKKLVLAFPVCSRKGAALLEGEADEVVCYTAPSNMQAVGIWYADFAQTEDEDVVSALRGAANMTAVDKGASLESSFHSRAVKIPVGDELLQGDLNVAPEAKGVVLFAHGSGSSRLSPRNRYVAGILNQHGFATLLVDLLTESEEEEDRYSAHLRFDIGLLADRLMVATNWLENDSDTGSLPIGYFGASTGAAAALVASVEYPQSVRAIVSRGGRPDLAGPALRRVSAPTLLIVGGNDGQVITLNEEAFAQLTVKEKKIEIVPGATHLFEERGALEQVAALAAKWFEHYLL